MKNVILHIWQLPQHIIAWVILLTCKPDLFRYYKGRRVYTWEGGRSLCLGGYMFISPLSIKQHGIEAAIAHEYGHSVQSVYFGCLYLIVIGLPSALNPFDGIRYYESYPEKWASDIGGVECVQYGPGSCNYKLKFKS